MEHCLAVQLSLPRPLPDDDLSHRDVEHKSTLGLHNILSTSDDSDSPATLYYPHPKVALPSTMIRVLTYLRRCNPPHLLSTCA